MKKVFIEVKESLLKKKFFSLLILIQITALFFLLAVLFLQFNDVDLKTRSFYAQFEGRNIYQLSDNLFGKEEEAFFQDENSIIILRDFYQALRKNEDFIYLNTILQPIGVRDFKGSSMFLEGYQEGIIFPPYDVNGEQYQVVRSLQINEHVLNTFDVRVAQGRVFQSEDFIYTNGEVVPIILGADYQSTFQIGDRLNIEYIFRQMEAEVIGILEPNTLFPVRENVEFYADRYIILPTFIIEHEPLNDEDALFQKRHLLSAVNGQIFTEMDTLQVRQVIYDISHATGFTDLTVIGANTIGIDFMMSMLNQNINLLIMLAVILFCFSVFSIVLSFIMKWEINVKKYGIHFISGAQVADILNYILAEMSFIVFLGICLSFIGITFIGSMPIIYHYIVIVVGLMIVVLGIVPMYIKLKNLDLPSLLKKRG